METVKTVLGVALVSAAIALLLPMLPKPRALPFGEKPLMAASAALAFLAVAAGALHLSFHAARREQALKGAALGILLLAIGLRLGWLGKPRTPQIPWLHDERAALDRARATGKPILVDFFAEWCAACKELDVHTFSDPAVQREVAERFVPLKVDATEETDEVARLEQKYGIPGLPTVLMMACNDPKPEPSCEIPADGPLRITGFIPPGEMIERMRRIQQ